MIKVEKKMAFAFPIQLILFLNVNSKVCCKYSKFNCIEPYAIIFLITLSETESIKFD